MINKLTQFIKNKLVIYIAIVLAIGVGINAVYNFKNLPIDSILLGASSIGLDTFEYVTSSASTTATKNMTVASNSNTILVVMITGYDIPGSEVDSVTWNTSESFTYITGSYGDNGDVQWVEAWYLLNPTATTANLVVDFDGSDTPSATVNIWSLYGINTADPIGAVSEYSETSGEETKQISITTETADSWVLEVLGLGGTTSPRISPVDGQTERLDIAANGNYDTWAGDVVVASAGATNVRLIDDINDGDWSQSLAIEIKTATAAIEQEGFAFGNDDGSESAHTFDTQDTNIIEELGTKTLRLILDSDNDPASNAYKLKYQKNGSGGYEDVPVGSGVTVSPTPSSGDITESGYNSITSNINLDYPAYSDGDLVILHINAIQYTSGTQGINYPSGPNGETINVLIDNYSSSGGQYDVGMSVAYFIGDGSHSAGTLSITSDLTQRWTGAVMLIPAGEFNLAQPLSTEYSTNGATSGSTLTMSGFSADTDDGGGRLVGFVGADTDPISGTDTGWTALVNRDRGRSTIEIATRNTVVSNSESIGSATWAIASDAWGAIGYIIRPAITSNEVYVDTSGNVASGGEATTARLTAPSGKTTGDFTTGRRWDDENGSDSIDIADGYYTELEWILTTQSPATTDDYFEFRVYNGDTALDTYTVTPKWTIGTAGADTCTYSAGDWVVLYSDDCVVSSDVWIDSNGRLVIIRDGVGSFQVTNGAIIYSKDGAEFLHSPANIQIESSSNGIIYQKE